MEISYFDIFKHENDIFMYENEIFMYENEIFMHGIFTHEISPE